MMRVGSSRRASRNGGGSPLRVIAGLRPAAYYRWGIGIAVAGQGVASWGDVMSGFNRDLLQGTDGARPPLQSDNSILFNGTDEFLSVAWVNAQPITAYLLFKQISWTATDNILDFNNGGTGNFVQAGTTPEIRMNFGSALSGQTLTLDTYGAACGVANGASSSFQINNATPTTGDAGALTADIITLGGAGSGGSNFSNIQAKELILFAAAHDAPSRGRVIRAGGKMTQTPIF